MKIPLFPLNTVLFPGGRISLRIFEPRYVDMLSHCMRNEIGFGVCLLRENAGSKSPDLFHQVGTYTLIADWDLLDDGLLGLHCMGQKRFSVLESRFSESGFNEAEVGWRLDQTGECAPELMTTCLKYVQRRAEMDGLVLDLKNKERLKDPNWLGYRLAEMLPLTAESQQTVLEMDAPEMRLRTLHSVIQTIERRRLT